MPLTHAIAAFLKGVTLVEGHERWFELSDELLRSGCRLSWHAARLTLRRPNRPTAHWLTYVHRWLLSMVE